MKTITTNNRTLLFVEVPEKAHSIQVRCNSEMGDHLHYVRGGEKKSHDVPLDVGNYRLIATTDTITLIDKVRILGGKDPNHDWDRYFQSFLYAHSITGRHAIIEVL